MGSVEKIKTMTFNNRKVRVVLMPIYRSYFDGMLIQYINYLKDLETGFVFGNYEDSPKIGFVDRVMKRVGTILMRRDPWDVSTLTRARIQPEVMEYVN